LLFITLDTNKVIVYNKQKKHLNVMSKTVSEQESGTINPTQFPYRLIE